MFLKGGALDVSSNPILWLYGQDRPEFNLDQKYILGRASSGDNLRSLVHYLCKPKVCTICKGLGHDFIIIEIIEPYDHSCSVIPVGESIAGDSSLVREIRSFIDQNDITWW